MAKEPRLSSKESRPTAAETNDFPVTVFHNTQRRKLLSKSASDRQDRLEWGTNLDKASASEDKIHDQKSEDRPTVIPEAPNSGPAEVFEEPFASFPSQSSLDEMESLPASLQRQRTERSLRLKIARHRESLRRV
ncbi:unnamed protein product [Calypogeia fissa]